MINLWGMKKLTERERRASAWVAANRGALSEIARDLEVTPQFVHQVLRGERKSADSRVELALRKRGASV
jgi:predicted transcriptional regulator